MDFKKNNNDELDYIINTEDNSETKLDITLRKIFEWLICLILAVGVALLIRYYIVTPRIIEQPSMFPTLETGHRVLINRWKMNRNQDLIRGSIVTFEAPSVSYIKKNIDLSNPVAIYTNQNLSALEKFSYYILEINKTNYVKRVIGLSGDHIKIEDGKVYLNDELLNEPYLQPNVETNSAKLAFTDIIVPDGYVFVMGDNRPKSTDSRAFGCIPIEKVEGEILIRFWPLNLFGKV